MKSFIPLLAILAATPSNAGLATASITSMTISVYGIYATDKADCSTGWVTVSPFAASPTAVNLAAGPTLGTGGSLPSSIGCILIIMKSSVANGWAAGTYTSTTNGNSDNVCNAAGTKTHFLSNFGMASTVVTWPASTEKPTLDMTAAGLTMASSLPQQSSETGEEIMPLYLSVNSACTNAPSDTLCTASANMCTPPTSVGDQVRGMKLVAPAVTGTTYKFVINPDKAIGNNGSGQCDNTAAPLFSFALVQ